MPKVTQGFTATSKDVSRPEVEPLNPGIYKAIMSINGSKFIETPLPQNFSFSLSSEYNNPFNQPLSEILGGNLGGTIEKGITLGTGATSQNKWLSAAIWSGGSEFAIEVPFVLQAYKQPEPSEKVLKNMKKLLQLAAPSEEGGFLFSPGPIPDILGENTLEGDVVSVEIGTFFKMEPCVITSVTSDFDTQFDSDGNPIGAVVRVQFRSFWTCTKLDLDKYFITSTGN